MTPARKETVKWAGMAIASALFISACSVNQAPVTSAQPSTEHTILEEGREGRVVGGKEFRLAWADEFDGEALDKWTDRITGYGYGGWFHPGNCAYTDGEGHLVLALCAYPKEKVIALVKTQAEKDALLSPEEKRQYIPTVPHIHTRDSFLYGYHEVRFKLPLVAGPGLFMCFIGHDVGEVEIDVIEQCLYSRGKIVDYKASTVHWWTRYLDPGTGIYEKGHNYLGYQFQRLEGDAEETRRLASLGKKTDGRKITEMELLSIQKRGSLPGPLEPFNVLDESAHGLVRKVYIVSDNRHRWDDEQWHTVGMLWTRDCYSFYYDGELVCQIDQGLRHVPGRAIFGLRVMEGWDDAIVKSGRGDDPRTTPARVLLDYYRVYRNDEVGDVVYPGG